MRIILTFVKLVLYVSVVTSFALFWWVATAFLIPAWPVWLVVALYPIRFAKTTWKVMF